jgi:hypothetical protein
MRAKVGWASLVGVGALASCFSLSGLDDIEFRDFDAGGDALGPTVDGAGNGDASTADAAAPDTGPSGSQPTLIVFGTAAGGNIAFMTQGRFRIELTGGSHWRPTGHFDLSSASPDKNLLYLANTNQTTLLLSELDGGAKGRLVERACTPLTAELVETNPLRARFAVMCLRSDAPINGRVVRSEVVYTVYATGRTVVTETLRNESGRSLLLNAVAYYFAVPLRTLPWTRLTALSGGSIVYGTDAAAATLSISTAGPQDVNCEAPLYCYFVGFPESAWAPDAGQTVGHQVHFTLGDAGSSDLEDRVRDVRSSLLEAFGDVASAQFSVEEGAYTLVASGPRPTFTLSGTIPRIDPNFVLNGWTNP